LGNNNGKQTIVRSPSPTLSISLQASSVLESLTENDLQELWEAFARAVLENECKFYVSVPEHMLQKNGAVRKFIEHFTTNMAYLVEDIYPDW